MDELYMVSATITQRIGERALLTMWTAERVGRDMQQTRRELPLTQDEEPESMTDWLRLVFAAATEAL